MIMELFVIWDEAAKMSGKVFEANNEAIAWRIFEQSNKDNPYIDESHLYKIGTVNKHTNIIEPIEPKEIKPTELEEHELKEIMA